MASLIAAGASAVAKAGERAVAGVTKAVGLGSNKDGAVQPVGASDVDEPTDGDKVAPLRPSKPPVCEPGSESFTNNTERRKTQTIRRAAVTSGAETSASDSVKSEEKDPETTAALLMHLQSHGLFESLKKDLLLRIIAAMTMHEYKQGEKVITQDEAGDECYIVRKGTFEAYLEQKLEVAKKDPRQIEMRRRKSDTNIDAVPGAERENELGLPILTQYLEGAGFGELALLYNTPRACSVRCTSEEGAVAFSLDRVAFRQLVLAHNTGIKVGLEKRLASVGLLKDLPPSEISSIADVMTVLDVDDGEYIVEKGSEADALYLILAGEVTVHRKDVGDSSVSKDGEEELMRLGTDKFFGESCLSENEENRKRQANVVAVGNVRLGVLKAADFLAVCGNLDSAMNREFNRKAMRTVPLLKSNLTDAQLEELLREVEDVTYPSGETIFSQDEEGTSFYIIKSGNVEVQKGGKKVNALGPGDHFGERALQKAEPRDATVVSIPEPPATETRLFKLTKAQFESVLPPLVEIIDKTAAEREEQAARAARPEILFKELKLITVLGEGTFGRVRLVQYVNKGTPAKKEAFALKTLQKGQLVYYKQVEHVVNEKRILKMCFHPFILKLEGTYATKNQIYMLLEVALGGELFTHLRQENKFPVEKATLYAAMVTSAFNYLHARKIAHRDLKPENLLFDKEGYLKLVDFGFAKTIKDRTWTLCGTPEYLAPEIISNRGHNWGADWWTVGILIYEMLVGQPPFVGQTQIDTYHKITRGKYKMPTTMGRPVKDLISRLLMHNPAARLGCAHGGTTEVVSHDFFANIDWKALERRAVEMPFVPQVNDDFDTSNFDQYSDDDQASAWVAYNTTNVDATWKQEFGDPAKD